LTELIQALAAYLQTELPVVPGAGDTFVIAGS
jgi:hypothetical protein